MAHIFISRDKHSNMLSIIILVYFLLLLCCHVSCVLVNVTRMKQDIFSYPGSSDSCYMFCRKKDSYYYPHYPTPSKKQVCACECSYDYKTFVTAELSCVQDKDIRNTSQPLTFKLYIGEEPKTSLKNVTFNSKTTKIEFEPPNKYGGECKLNDIEELSHQNFLQWKSVKEFLSGHNIFELDDDHIETTYTWMDPDKQEGWKMLTLQWKDNSSRFAGSIMRVNVTCKAKGNRGSGSKTGLMVFKVLGTFRVSDNSTTSSTVSSAVSTTYYLTPTPSITTESTVLLYSTTPRLLSTAMTPSSLQLMTSSLLRPMTSSSLRPMTSSLLRPMTSSLSQTKMTPSTSFPSRSLSEAKRMTYSLTVSSRVASSSMAGVGPVTKSKSSSNAAVTGGVVGGIVILLLVVVVLVYVMRKRRTIMRRKHSDLGHINPASVSSLTLPTMSNPLNDGVYENPEVFNDGTNRRSGVMSIDSAMYDACLIVENPSTRETKSVYDNIPDPPENTYKALDPAKRDPSAKYQSLIRDEHEYSTVADLIPGAHVEEPLYSEVERGPYINGGRHAPTLPPFTSRKPSSSATAEPIYNELESSDNYSKEGIKKLTPEENASPLPPPLARRKPPSSEKVEPIYNELESSDNHSKEGVEQPKPEENPAPPPQPPRNPPASAEPMNGFKSNDNHSKEGVEQPKPEENPAPPPQPPRNPPASAEPMNGFESNDNHSKEGVEQPKPEENPAPPPQPTRNPPASAEPMNGFDSNDNHSKEGAKPEENDDPTTSCQSPQDLPTPNGNETEDDKIANDNKNGQEESIDAENAIANELKESIDVDGENEPVYSVLEEIGAV